VAISQAWLAKHAMHIAITIGGIGVEQPSNTSFRG